jgi:hypothetical protein
MLWFARSALQAVVFTVRTWKLSEPLAWKEST